MKIQIFMIAFVCSITMSRSQGLFQFNNSSAPTRLYSLDGPLAGPGIWAHMFYGHTLDNLSPIGGPREHSSIGVVFAGNIVVPDADPGMSVYVQMIAWDGTLWGTALSGV